ncbi:MAG: thioredoxin [Clostridiales bacterium]|nr:thioredoxin [Clostridiales bacterium]
MAVIAVNEDNFKSEVLESETPVLVDFWAPWCGPCKMLGPLVDKISEEYEGKLKFCKCNVDDSTDIAASYGVSSIPALKIFKGGEVTSESLGFRPLPELKKFVDQALG